jgi:hypothetical protein
LVAQAFLPVVTQTFLSVFWVGRAFLPVSPEDHVRPREGQECPSARPHITGKNAYATKAEADPTWRNARANDRMTITPEAQTSSPRSSRGRESAKAFFPAFLLALLATAISAGVLGATLGLFFAGVFVCALLVPPLTGAEEEWTNGLLAAVGAWLGMSLAWLVVTFRGQLPGDIGANLIDTLACIAIAAAFTLALAGLTRLLRHVHLPIALASFLTMLVALAWLAWPVWASPWLGGHDRLVANLVAPHPMLAINSVLQHLGLWNQQPLAYNLTVLNQDAYLPLPQSILPAVGVHTVVGAVCLVPLLRKRWTWGFDSVGKRANAGAVVEGSAPAAQSPSPLPCTGERG